MVNWASSTATVTTTIETPAESSKLTSTITRTYPTFRDEPLQTAYRWLEGRRHDDGAEGLWRIHDTLYDLTDFISLHPGGQQWIRMTKGTDITEAFETHHMGVRVERLLPKYSVRPAQQPRNVRLTFHEDGFYRTLKRRVHDKLGELDRKPARRSQIILDSLLFTSFALSVAAINLGSYLVAAMCALFVCWTMICAHNFFHQKDNWRMLAFNLALMSYREMRIAHAMSHHMYPNSVLDLEITLFEPFLCWLPQVLRKNWIQRFGSWVYGPFIYVTVLPSEFFKRIWVMLTTGVARFYTDDLVNLAMPVLMYLTSSCDVWTVLKMWLFIVLFTSFCYTVIGVSAAHQHPEVIHWGDSVPEDVDFGIYQLSCIIDRADVKGSQFKVLTSFGDHCLHHMFPTLDHGVLPQLYPVFLETCAEFNLEYRERPWWHMFFAQYKQLARVDPITYVPRTKTQ